MPSRSLKRTGWKQILQNGLQNEMTKATLSNGAPEEIRTPDPQIRSLCWGGRIVTEPQRLNPPAL
jgi:hypothetical protein